ncbi:MAG TPA: LuxR C-terminal-related transcriptional regulator [Jiangellales bacterium]|nr:LuxR C-terminal-related transcriptional regulator [Jiangellales bacterium]
MTAVPGPDPLTAARQAVAARQWDAAVAAFAAADAVEGLTPDDLRLWAMSSYLLRRTQDALGALTRAYQQFAARTEVDEAARCGFWIVYALANRGEIGQASGWLTRVDRLLSQRTTGRGPGHGYLLAFDAFRAAAIEHDYGRGRAAADQAVAIGREHSEADLVALALNVGGRALIYSGEVGRGLHRLDEAMVEVVADEVSPIVVGTVYCSVIEACEEVMELGRAAEWTDALARWCDEQHGMLTFNGQCLTHRATLLRLGGQLDAAAAEAARACQGFGAADEPATGRAIYELAQVQRLTGDLSYAEANYRRAAEWGHDPQPGLALLRLAQGRSEAASTMMCRRMEETTGELDRLRLLPAYVEILLDAGDVETAAGAARELTTTAAMVRTTAAEAEAGYATGAVALAQGEPGQALVALRDAFRRWRSLRAPLEAARCRIVIARACTMLGDHDAASVEMAAARRALTDMGARSDLSRLRDQGVGTEFGLTAREIEVLALVAAGKTNRVIAAELALAVKTVDRHVANILSKLGVTSRTAATAAAYEHGLL